MSDTLPSIALVAAAYLVGSVPSAYLIGRLIAGIDIREYGSGNVGASNVSVHVGKKWVAPIAFFDVFVKGLLPVYLGGSALLDLGPTAQAMAALAAMCGHNWPMISEVLRWSRDFGRTWFDGRLRHSTFHPLGNDPRHSLLAHTMARFGGLLAFGDNLAARLGDMGWLRELGSRVWWWIRVNHDYPESYIRRIQRFVVNLWGVDAYTISVEPHDLRSRYCVT